MSVKANMLSKYQRELYSTIYEQKASDSTSPKVTANLYEKTKYVLHIANLQLCVNMGLVLPTIHRVIKLKQPRWLKPYIDICSNPRSKSTDGFVKKLLKLLPNSVY